MWNGTQSVGESSSSTSLSSQQDVEDDRMIAFVLSEEYAKLDGAVAKRLSNLAPVPVRCLICYYLAHRTKFFFFCWDKPFIKYAFTLSSKEGSFLNFSSSISWNFSMCLG